MKKTIALTLAMAAMLCGCEEMPDNVSSLALAPKATTAATAPQETTAADTKGDTAVAASTTTAAADDNKTAETAQETTAAAVTEAAPEADSSVSADSSSSQHNDPFEGYYVDQNDSSYSLSIDLKGDTYYVSISHKLSDNESYSWFFTGIFSGRQVLEYTNGIKNRVSIGEDGSVSTAAEYTDGTGNIHITAKDENNGMAWLDNKEDAGAYLYFVKQ